ncbi:hypothetical protein [Bradyrhizobium sp. Rc2d]|uniref:hypothetical protein n=1 Tax=Bradyrhizobium sp. Rc2d TaxID=1855321 RepID=UPI00115F9C54|nr:hypothetical protein [Bradyrhizobium sp. Rc2d]
MAKYQDPLRAAAECLGAKAKFDALDTQFANCLMKARADSDGSLQCMQMWPAMADKLELTNCIRGNQAQELLQCATAAAIPLGPAKECIEKANSGSWDREKLLTCVANVNPAVRDAVAVIRCVSSGNRPNDIIASCTEGLIRDSKTRQVLSCAAQDTHDKGAMFGCMAAPFLGEEEGRLLTCATQSGSYAGFALCAAGPKMNPEWMIAAQCAVSSGGEPTTTASCTAGWLTVNEIEKCFSQGVGGDGCFGKNNTIVKFINNYISDITKGPGPNNEVVKALASAGIEFKDVSFETPLGGREAALPKAGRDFDRWKNEAGKWVGERASDLVESLNPF